MNTRPRGGFSKRRYMSALAGTVDSSAKPRRRVVKHFYQSIDGWFSFRDVYDAAVYEAREGATFVEVGSWYGRSTAYMAVEIANSGKKIAFFCVDTWEGSIDCQWMVAQLAKRGGSAFPFFRENLQRGGVWNEVTPIVQPSIAAAGRFSSESIDFIMIDGAHDYRNVRDDVRAWLPKLKPQGLIAGDDAHWPGVLIGVHETIPMSEVEIINNGANWIHRKRRPERGLWSICNRREDCDFIVYMPYVDRPDLMNRAVLSIRELWQSLVIVDQSAQGMKFEEHSWVRNIGGVFRAAKGGMSLTQMMNWAQAEARERRADYLLYMHTNVECSNHAALRALEFARAHPRAGAVFTQSDAFVAFRVAALEDVGPWDETFQSHFADNDYYRRIQLRGWECYDFGWQKGRYHIKQTLCGGSSIGTDIAAELKWHEEHYRHKWGGVPGQERFSIPYNGAPF